MLAALALASLAAAPSLAVSELQRVNVTPGLASFAAEHVGQALGAHGFRVVTQRDLEAMLGLERQKQLLGCADDGSSCTAELAQSLGVDLLVTGTLARLGTTLQVNLRVLSARDGEVRARFTGSADDEGELPGLLTRGADELAEALLEPIQSSAATLPRPTVASWILLGSGVALAAAGGVALIVSGLDHASLLAPATSGQLTVAEGQATRDRGRALQVVGPIALGVGGAAIVTGVVLWLRGPRAAPTVAALVAPGGAAIVLSGDF